MFVSLRQAFVLADGLGRPSLKGKPGGDSFGSACRCEKRRQAAALQKRQPRHWGELQGEGKKDLLQEKRWSGAELQSWA
jgi:hypothetical protein